MKCKCGSDRILAVSGNVSDRCYVEYQGDGRDGYVPRGLNIGSGDYLEFNVCLNCGMNQGTFPVPEEALKEVFAS